MSKKLRYLVALSVFTLSLALPASMSTVYAYEAEKTQINVNSEATKSVVTTKDEGPKVNEILKVSQNLMAQASESNEIVNEGTAVQRVNDGNEDLSDYTVLKIKKVKSDNLSIVKKFIQIAKIQKGSNLTKEEITNTVSEAVDKITAALSDMDQGKATIDQYKLIEITVVDDGNLADINNWLKGKRYTTIAKTSDVVNKIVQATKNINSGVDVLSDYTTLEIFRAKSDYIPLIRKEIVSAKEQKGALLTTIEIKQVAEKVVTKIKTILDNMDQGQATLNDYTYIGAINVNTINLQDVNDWVKGKGWTELTNAVVEINTIVEPLRKINAGIETEADYEFFGLDGINKSNIESIREVIVEKKQIKGTDLTKAEILEAVDEAIKILNFFEAINSGTATLDDYTYIGATGVNSSNLQDINEELKGKNYKTLKKVQENIDALNNAIKNINQGTDNVVDYETLKIEGVTGENLEFIKADIKVLRDNKGSDLTKGEIKDSVSFSLRKLKAIEDVNNGVATLEDYTVLGITEITEANINYVNGYIKGNSYTKIEDIKAKAGDLIKLYDAYARINIGTGTLEDYKLIGAVISREDFLAYINLELTGKGYFTLAEVQGKIDVVIKVRIAIENINNGVATVDDYTTIGATGVTVDILVYINAELKGKNLDVLSDIQGKIDAVIGAIDIIGRVNAGTATVADYVKLGLKIVTDSNLSYVNGQVVGKGYLTVGEIKSAVEIAIKIRVTYGKINLGQATVEDYQFVGTTGVTIQNLAYINAHVRGKNFGTIVTLQVRVNIVVEIYESVLKINRIYGNINLGQATIEDYEYLGVWCVTADNLAYVNAGLKGKTFTLSIDVDVNVTALVNVFNTFVRINTGEATVADYEFIGATGVTADKLVFINLNIKGNGYFVLSDVQVKLDVLVKVYNAYVEINAGQGTLDDYIKVGAVGVTVDNLAYINLNIKGNGYFVLTDAQAKLDVLVKMFNAYVGINAGQGTLDDYTTVGVVGVTVDNLAFINLNVKGNQYFVLADIQVKLDVLVKVYNAYVEINAGQGTVDDYVLIGATGVNVNNLIYINADLKGKQYTVIADVQVKIDAVVLIYDSLIRINAGEGTLADYQAVGAVGVTVINLNYVNADIKGKNYVTTIEIKARIDANINVYNALFRINAGKGKLDDYNVVGAVGVTKDNLIYVNNNIKGRGLQTFNEAKSGVTVIVAQYELDLKVTAILNKINLGTATVEEYEFIGLTGVTLENLIYVNAEAKGKGYNNQIDIQESVDQVVSIYNYFVTINNGTATLDDYTALGITGVTGDNLTYVNADLKDKNFVIAIEIQGRISSNSDVYLALVRINAGEGTVADYNSFGVVGVTGENLEYFNKQLMGGNSVAVVQVNVKVNIIKAFISIDAGQGTVNEYVLIGATGVTADNVAYVNAELQGKGYSSLIDVQAGIDKVTIVVDIFVRVNNGEATIDDYTKLGITGVLETNIAYVNGQVKGKNYLTALAIKGAVDSIPNKELKDVNNDGEFSLLDLGIDGRHYGEDPTSLPNYNTDTVINGAIDDDDLSQIGKLIP